MPRVVQPELLDDLPPGDPRSVGSRADLRRLNAIMGHAGILAKALGPHLHREPAPSRPLRICELGAGDGTLLLKLARRWSALGWRAEVLLLDRHNLVSEETRRAFHALNCSVECVATDVAIWLEQSALTMDVMLANLFLHHFSDPVLRAGLRLAAARTKLFIACEPRRAVLALSAARLLWLIGCTAVTRHDAVLSVRAGFVGKELSALWPASADWELSERSAGWFSHCFVARRNG